MFKNGNTSNANTDANAPDKLNRIVEGTSIIGDINSESNIRIDGNVTGTITTKGRLVIGVTGVINGDVFCTNADVEGLINGVVTVSELLSLKATSKIEGNIITKKLFIEAGASFNGTCSMDENLSKKPLSNSKITAEGILQD